MNQRDKLKVQKKRLRHYHSLRLDVMSAENRLVRTLLSTTANMLRESLTGKIIRILRVTSLQSYPSSERIQNNSYSYAKSTITLSGGEQRSKMKDYGEDSVGQGG